jgi:hypothetical protein
MKITSSINPHNMSKAELKEYFQTRCDNWNLNSSLMDIANNLKEEGIRSDSREYQVFSEEFNKFFNTPQISIVDAIREILEADEWT